jgi:UDP-N-acetylglucosamine enolpyruvyl transferase
VLITAGLAAKGEPIIGYPPYHLNRAFERIEEKRLSS